MSIFNWQAGNPDGRVVSKWIWLYFALSALGTAILVVAWKLVSRHIDRKVRKESEEDFS
jgi:hypothetical protein